MDAIREGFVVTRSSAPDRTVTISVVRYVLNVVSHLRRPTLGASAGSANPTQKNPMLCKIL